MMFVMGTLASNIYVCTDCTSESCECTAPGTPRDIGFFSCWADGTYEYENQPGLIIEFDGTTYFAGSSQCSCSGVTTCPSALDYNVERSVGVKFASFGIDRFLNLYVTVDLVVTLSGQLGLPCGCRVCYNAVPDLSLSIPHKQKFLNLIVLAAELLVPVGDVAAIVNVIKTAVNIYNDFNAIEKCIDGILQTPVTPCLLTGPMLVYDSCADLINIIKNSKRGIGNGTLVLPDSINCYYNATLSNETGLLSFSDSSHYSTYDIINTTFIGNSSAKEFSITTTTTPTFVCAVPNSELDKHYADSGSVPKVYTLNEFLEFQDSLFGENNDTTTDESSLSQLTHVEDIFLLSWVFFTSIFMTCL